MNIFLHELKVHRKFTIIWTISLVVLIVLFLAMFPPISQEAEEFKKLMEGFPEAVRIALGLAVENIGSIIGFYSYVFLYISLLGAIQAMNLGTSIVSKEVREKTADFLLTKPVTRTQIMTAKLLAALTSLVITNVIYIAAATIMASLVETQDYSTKIFLLISLTLFFLQLIFLALGVIVSVVVPKINSVLPISLGTVFAFFIISALVSIIGDSALRYITPFEYFDTAYIVENASYEFPFIITAFIFIVTSITASYFIYNRKDVPAV